MLNTVNASSIHRSSYTFWATGKSTRIFDCAVRFSYPTGVVVADVERQYWNRPYVRSWSSPHASTTVAGLINSLRVGHAGSKTLLQQNSPFLNCGIPDNAGCFVYNGRKTVVVANSTACADFPTGVEDRAPEDHSRKNAARGPRPRGRLPDNMPHLFVFFCPR